MTTGPYSHSRDRADRSATEAIPSLEILLEGNRRFVAGKPRYRRDIDAARAAAAEQHPMAAVFTCVDSRVTAESLFDCDFGQLIVVRTAGHVPDRAATASLAFAAEELSVDLIVVLGHERCGAIGLAVETARADDGAVRDNFVLSQLRSVAAAGIEESASDPHHATMLKQIDRTVTALRNESSLGGCDIVGARYDLDYGTVHLTEPMQAA